MNSKQQYGWIIFAIGLILSAAIIAGDAGFYIHLQTYSHGSLNSSLFSDLSPFLVFLFVAIFFGVALIFKGTVTLKGFLKRFVCVLLITGIFAGGSLQVGFIADSNEYQHTIPTLQEKMAIQDANYDSQLNSVSLTVKLINELNATVNSIIIKDQTGNVVTNIQLPYNLTSNQVNTVNAKLEKPLVPGFYTATLTTSKGGSFVSPSFSVS